MNPSTLSTLFREAVGGFREIARQSDTRLVAGLGGVASILIGALDVFYVVIAIGLLGLGPSAPGYLMAALAQAGSSAGASRSSASGAAALRGRSAPGWRSWESRSRSPARIPGSVRRSR